MEQQRLTEPEDSSEDREVDPAPNAGSELVECRARGGFALLPTPPRIDLKTIDDVRVEMARVYRDMRARRIETQEGTRFSYVLAQIGKLIVSGELEKRLEAVEGVLKHRAKSK
jgi:hypothetical protein